MPVFMQEPPLVDPSLLQNQRETPTEFHHSSLSDIVEEEADSDVGILSAFGCNFVTWKYI